MRASSVDALRQGARERSRRARLERETYRAGVRARHYVLGAMDPSLDSEEEMIGHVCRILRGQDAQTASQDVHNRAQAASEVLSGWVTRREADRPSERLLWLRLIGQTVVEVRETPTRSGVVSISV